MSCFGDNLLQQWDVTDAERSRLTSTVAPCVQPNMMHVPGNGKMMYVSNSTLATLIHAGRYYVRLGGIGSGGIKVDPFFNIDLNKFPTGPARGHDMLMNRDAGVSACRVKWRKRPAVSGDNLLPRLGVNEPG